MKATHLMIAFLCALFVLAGGSFECRSGDNNDDDDFDSRRAAGQAATAPGVAPVAAHQPHV